MSDRIGWLQGIIKSYEEDALIFGLTSEDKFRLSAWREELAALTAPTDKQQRSE